MSLTAEQILALQDREVVEVPAFGATVFVRSLTVGEQLKLESGMKEPRDSGDKESMMVAQLAAYLSDEKGVALFSEESARGLIDRRPADVRTVLEAAQKLNGWTRDEEEAILKN